MRVAWAGVLLFLLSTVARDGLPDALSGSVQTQPDTPESPSIAATSPSQNTPGISLALDASSARSAPGATREDSEPAADLSALFYLHQTRDESPSEPNSERSGVHRY